MGPKSLIILIVKAPTVRACWFPVWGASLGCRSEAQGSGSSAEGRAASGAYWSVSSEPSAESPKP